MKFKLIMGFLLILGVLMVLPVSAARDEINVTTSGGCIKICEPFSTRCTSQEKEQCASTGCLWEPVADPAECKNIYTNYKTDLIPYIVGIMVVIILLLILFSFMRFLKRKHKT